MLTYAAVISSLRRRPRRKDRPLCGAKTRAGGTCLVRVEFGKARCRFHGGLSTGRSPKPVAPGLQKPSAGAGVRIENGRWMTSK